ncbi:MAG: hypothetical protein ACR2PT_13300 [Endozoicomonas sp.]
MCDKKPGKPGFLCVPDMEAQRQALSFLYFWGCPDDLVVKDLYRSGMMRACDRVMCNTPAR